MQNEEMVVTSFIARELNVPPASLGLDLDLRTRGQWASGNQIRLAQMLEKRFLVRFEEEEHLRWFTIRSIQDSLRRQRERASQSQGVSEWVSDHSPMYAFGVSVSDEDDILYEAVLEVVQECLGVPISELRLHTNLQQRFSITVVHQTSIAMGLHSRLSEVLPDLDVSEFYSQRSLWQTPLAILVTLQLVKLLRALAPS